MQGITTEYQHGFALHNGAAVLDLLGISDADQSVAKALADDSMATPGGIAMADLFCRNPHP